MTDKLRMKQVKNKNCQTKIFQIFIIQTAQYTFLYIKYIVTTYIYIHKQLPIACVELPATGYIVNVGKKQEFRGSWLSACQPRSAAPTHSDVTARDGNTWLTLPKIVEKGLKH